MLVEINRNNWRNSVGSNRLVGNNKIVNNNFHTPWAELGGVFRMDVK